jgi:hypothetical protein
MLRSGEQRTDEVVQPMIDSTKELKRRERRGLGAAFGRNQTTQSTTPPPGLSRWSVSALSVVALSLFV